MPRALLLLGVLVAVLLIVPPTASGQVVREQDVRTIAGVLGETGDSYDDFTFVSDGDEILAVSVDSQVYDKKGSEEGEGEGEDEGGCTEAEGGCDEGSGCDDGEGGAGGLCLQLLDEAGNVVQAAGKPRLPGWQRDPRMLVIIPPTTRQETYTIRVSLADGPCGDLQYGAATGAEARPYLLHVSLRAVAPEGDVTPGSNRSRNRF